MRFYTTQHTFYCGIDLHVDWMYFCVIDADGEGRVHKNLRTNPQAFLQALQPFREDVVVCVECMFTWYWLADLCEDEGIPFVLGHALYMRAIHGGKAKNDRIDSHKIAALLRGGLIPQAYLYPRRMRATPDLLRRRNHLMHKRAELYAHIQNTASQYNLSEPLGRIAKPRNRRGLIERFDHGGVQQNMAVDMALIDCYDPLLTELERSIEKTAHSHEPVSLALLRTIPGVGNILALVRAAGTSISVWCRTASGPETRVLKSSSDCQQTRGARWVGRQMPHFFAQGVVCLLTAGGLIRVRRRIKSGND
jgi:transposase